MNNFIRTTWKWYKRCCLAVMVIALSAQSTYWRRQADPEFKAVTDDSWILRFLGAIDNNLTDEAKEFVHILAYSFVLDTRRAMGFSGLVDPVVTPNIADYIRDSNDPYLYAGAFGLYNAEDKFGPSDQWPDASHFQAV